MILRFSLLSLSILLLLSLSACSVAGGSTNQSISSGSRSDMDLTEPSSAVSYWQATHSMALAESRVQDAPAQHYSRARMTNVSAKNSTTNSLADDSVSEKQDLAKELTLSGLGSRWLYGQGLGTSMVNISTSILFPPYAVYLLGNAGLEIAGLQTLYATDALPEKPRSFVLEFYDGVTSVPGRLAALIAGRAYHEKKPLSPAAAMLIVQNYAQEQ